MSVLGPVAATLAAVTFPAPSFDPVTVSKGEGGVSIELSAVTFPAFGAPDVSVSILGGAETVTVAAVTFPAFEPVDLAVVVTSLDLTQDTARKAIFKSLLHMVEIDADPEIGYGYRHSAILRCQGELFYRQPGRGGTDSRRRPE